jgi:hypothetical protein
MAASCYSSGWGHALSRRTVVFGFQGGESVETVSRKKDYRKDAQQRWGFLTHYDLSTIKNEAQLRAMVKGRSIITEAQATSEV